MPQNAIGIKMSATNSRQTGAIKSVTASRALNASDLNRTLNVNSGSGVTITLPSDATAPLPVPAAIPIFQGGAGQITIAADSGATVNSAGGLLHSAAQYSMLQAIKTAPNTWLLIGDRA